MNINIEKFFQFAIKNGQLQDILKGNNNTGDIVKIATENGYIFTEEELQSALNQIRLSKVDEAELDTQALANVAGGMMPTGPKRTPWATCGYTCGC
uniref:Nif11 domain-containing protein n=1 Tax=Cyanothece sp. (strain PCC 7425 / ATCC 29141) TaxID=395961 RepID=B8HVH9_CYAP4